MSVSACPLQDERSHRIEGALKVPMRNVSCRLVDGDGMRNVMQHAGWAKDDTVGVVGFQVGKNVYVREDTPWTVLHELVHKAGVNSDRLNRYVAEGLTEAIAISLKRRPQEHRPTYPAETRWVQEVLLPKLGMSATDLGALLAKSSSPPRELARLLVERDSSLDRARLERELQPQKPERPSIGSACARGKRTIVGSRIGSPPYLGGNREAPWMGLALAGTTVLGALGLPSLVRRLWP